MALKQHPFQRKAPPRKVVLTPFQKALIDCIREYSEDGEMLSGRQLSALLGKSANHISQMLNDGFVPSGAAILDMAEVLNLDSEGRDRLILAAMETKAAQRSRDNFWINESQRMLAARDEEIRRLRAFLASEGLVEKFERAAKAKARAPKASKKTASKR